MNRLFKEDTFLMRGLSRAVDLVILNVLWVVCSLPVVTFGAATTAVYDVMLRYANGDDGSAARLFFHAFKENFKRSTALWLIMLVLGVIVGGDLYMGFFTELAGEGTVRVAVMGFSLILAILWLMTLSWVFVLQSHFDNPVKATLKNALLVGCLNFPKTVVFGGSIVACLWLSMKFPNVIPFWMFIGYALVAFFLAKWYLPVLKKLETMQGDDEKGA